MQPESSGMTVEEITHAVIDALERVGTGGDYYKINHSSRAEIEELAKMIAGWLARRGIAVVE